MGGPGGTQLCGSISDHRPIKIQVPPNLPRPFTRALERYVRNKERPILFLLSFSLDSTPLPQYHSIPSSSLSLILSFLCVADMQLAYASLWKRGWEGVRAKIVNMTKTYIGHFFSNKLADFMTEGLWVL